MATALAPIKHLRWYICGLLFLVTTINYVDRVSMGAMEPILREKIGWDAAQYAWINFSFQLAYAMMFPLAGRFLDRVGVRQGLMWGVIVWSLAAMGHALASTVLGFAVARFILGLGEATNFPASIKAVAEWFPRRQRALATGIFNTGTNVGAMLQGAIVLLAGFWGWQAAFVVLGLSGLFWLALWMWMYRSPEDHPRLSPADLADIRSDNDGPATGARIPWPSLLRYRQAWAFILAKMLTDPVWWFYLTWLPPYLNRERHLSALTGAALLIWPYLAADVGSIFGGWLSGYMIRRGMAPGRARLVTMGLFAIGLPISVLSVRADSAGAAIALISIATSCHQAWSANVFTLASDAFPRRAVASVVGFGGMCGAIGGLFMNLIAGGVIMWVGSYTPLFIFAGAMHPLAWISIRALVGKGVTPVDLEAEGGLRTAFSPALLIGGVGLVVLGAAIIGVARANWQAVLVATKNSSAAAWGSIAAAILIVGMGLALVYASRGPRKQIQTV